MHGSIPVVVGLAMVASFVGGVGYSKWDRDAQALAPAAAMEDAWAFAPAAPFGMEDARGDAKDLGATRVGYGPGCLISCETLPLAANREGAAAEAFDVLATGLAAETPDDVVLYLRVAKLTAGFPELASVAAERRVGEYAVCWTPAPENASRCALLDVSTHDDHDATLAASFHIVGADSCNDWAWCAWRIPVEVTYGSPGEIRFTVPKAHAGADGAPLALAELRATSGWFATNKALPLWHFAWTAHAGGDHTHDHVGLLEPANLADVADGAHETVALTAPAARDASVPASAEPLMMPGVGNLAGAGGIRDHPELDLVAFDLRQEGDDLVATFAMAKFDAMPSYDIQFATIFGARGGTTFEVGLMQANGDAYGYAGRCVSFGCHDGYLVQVPFEVLPGGLIEVRAPRSTWEELADGAVIDLTLAYTMFGEANVDVGTAGAPVYGNVHSGSVVDVAFGGLPYVIGATKTTEFVEHDHEHRE